MMAPCLKWLAATRNPHKLAEFRLILKNKTVLLGLDEIENAPRVEEDGETFEENARKKARELCAFSGMWTLADDSGLEVEALDGRPGVYSARFAGENSKDGDNLEKLLEMLQGVSNRRARFRCVLALCSPDGTCRTVQGTCRGTITRKPYGRNGFGYDPVFLPEGESLTFAQMPPHAKNRISHRALALKEVEREWPRGPL